MLASLHIRNFALIEELQLDLDQGMTTITGETGAGKSIVVDALSLAIGERADHHVIRHGCDKTDVTAGFHIESDSTAHQWLKEQELDESDECLLRRVIQREGRSRCFINGRSVTLAMLKELGDCLVDIHGQHAHQSLVRPHQQLSLIDELLPNQKHRQSVCQIANEYRKVSQQLESIKNDMSQRLERAELLSYQLEELETLQLGPNSIEQLEQEHSRVANAQQLAEQSQHALSQLYEDESGAYNQLNYHLEQLSQLSRKDPSLNGVTELLQSATTYLQESVDELRHYQDSLEVSPERLNELDEQLSHLHDLARKHRVELHQLPEVEENIRTELESLQDTQANTLELEQKQTQLIEDYESAASKLTKHRQKVVKQLAKDVTAHMQKLGMDGGQFSVKLEARNEAYSALGSEQIEFEVSANPGQPLRSLAKVASGGELSRISLAIQMITAQKQVTPCLIFDEVDVGIGGQTADIVGRMLATLSQHTQVICVTHQPQVAARGNHQLKAVKSKYKDKTETQMQRLSEPDRIDEIARMVGGQEITESTLQHAQELLSS
ncbi:DNA repair protein RecN [Pleionea sp. CnH1-48]|uniref:DNA repair protein RecN n=1 Tax=Pleionea sp. CnH1-48 TaxID=2954494 RepID=UPI002097E73D|nr:DNA repair protein RecN [Pleionea sp. CnH1-48]MCO7224619.1 DNA repair protein RecN [Pleionea sp. CnH1-48]